MESFFGSSFWRKNPSILEGGTQHGMVWHIWYIYTWYIYIYTQSRCQEKIKKGNYMWVPQNSAT